MPMTQARRSNRRIQPSGKNKPIKHGLREIVLIFFCFVALYLFVSLFSYYGGDPGIAHSSKVEEIRNKGGIIGALFADLFFYLFGYFAYLFPIMVGYMGWLIYKGRHHAILAEPKSLIIPGIGFVLTLSAGCGLAIVHFTAESALLPTHAGGILGMWTGNGLVAMVDQLGATLILLAIFFTGITLLTGLSWLKLMDILGYHTLLWLPVVKKYMSRQFWPWFRVLAKQWLQIALSWSKIFLHKLQQWAKVAYQRWQERRNEWRKEQYYVDAAFDDDEYHHNDEDFLEESEPRVKKTLHPHSQADLEKNSTPIETQEEVNVTLPEPPPLPSLSLLDPVPTVTLPTVQMLSQLMTETFAALQVEVEINAVHSGPVLTRFEVNSITPINTNHLDELSEALAKELKIESVQIVENQSGMLEIEMPSLKRQTIYLSELLKTPEYQDNLSSLVVGLGKDVGGQPVIVDLTRIPHILIAGLDVQEKNMAINTLILSLLYKSTPVSMRFLLVDSTTQVFSIYENLPHLLTPVITEMEQTPLALQWCVQEMERRYRLMASIGVRNIEDYNQTQQLQEDETHFLQNADTEESNRPLYYIVIIINELGDLMTGQLEKPVEQSITRLTQKARAAGIHVILATEYPKVNVVTGLIKANIPTRMAFQVNNKNESRTILGQVGAETLLGQGDMLYMTAGTGMPVRVHGSVISEHELQNVVADLREHATPEYIDFNSND